MRWSRLAFASLTMLLTLCAPALAQGSPSASQYDPGGGCSGSAMCVQSVEDSVEDMVDSAEQGTGAVNGAMNDAVAAPVASASASPGAVLSAEADASPESAPSPEAGATDGSAAGDHAAEEEGLGSITVLPETGGAPPGALVSGALLVALGLLVRGVVKR